MGEVIKEILPENFHFRPTDEILVSYFLFKKKKGEPLKEVEEKLILERDLYGEDATPWDVLTEDDPWDDISTGSKCKKSIYVFCKLIPTKKGGKRMSRTAGIGKWEGKAVCHQIISTSNGVIGERRQFTFKPKKGYEEEMKGRGHWIMHEYSSRITSSNNTVNEGDQEDNTGNYVICKITKEILVGKRKFSEDIVGGADGISQQEMEKKRVCGGEMINHDWGSFSNNNHGFDGIGIVGGEVFGNLNGEEGEGSTEGTIDSLLMTRDTDFSDHQSSVVLEQQEGIPAADSSFTIKGGEPLDNYWDYDKLGDIIRDGGGVGLSDKEIMNNHNLKYIFCCEPTQAGVQIQEIDDGDSLPQLLVDFFCVEENELGVQGIPSPPRYGSSMALGEQHNEKLLPSSSGSSDCLQNYECGGLMDRCWNQLPPLIQDYDRMNSLVRSSETFDYIIDDAVMKLQPFDGSSLP